MYITCPEVHHSWKKTETFDAEVGLERGREDFTFVIISFVTESSFGPASLFGPASMPAVLPGKVMMLWS